MEIKRSIKKPYVIKKQVLYFGVLLLLIVLACPLYSIQRNQNAMQANSGESGDSASSSSSITKPVKEVIESSSKTDPMTLGSITQLINKNHGLPQDYEPGDLIVNNLPAIRETYLRAEAANALAELFNEANKNGIHLKCCSGYRSYSTQIAVFDSEAANSGQAAAEATTAPPGYSEHQTGLCIDVTSDSIGNALTTDFINTPEGQWLDQNSWKFGFIIRYPNGKEAITGYTYEPWHIRYLGKDVAKAVYHTGKTYEEYLGIVN